MGLHNLAQVSPFTRAPFRNRAVLVQVHLRPIAVQVWRARLEVGALLELVIDVFFFLVAVRSWLRGWRRRCRAATGVVIVRVGRAVGCIAYSEALLPPFVAEARVTLRARPLQLGELLPSCGLASSFSSARALRALLPLDLSPPASGSALDHKH